MGITKGAPQESDEFTLCAANDNIEKIAQAGTGESLGVSQHAISEQPELEEATDDVTPLTPEQLRLQRYEKMLKRAGFAPATHLTHLQNLQKKEGADAMSLGVTSRHVYEEIFGRRAFDEFFFQIPPKKSALQMMPDVARKILSKDPTADIERKEGETKAGTMQSGGASKHRDFEEEARVGLAGSKKDLYGRPGLAPPQNNILNNEGRHTIFSGYEGAWKNGKMEGFGTYRFADGFTYKGTMHDNWPCKDGTARYANGGEYMGRWLDGKYEGYGRLTSPTGTIYEGSWHEGRRSGKGKLKYKSGSTYEGDFLKGVFHGKGRFESANLNVTYQGWWNSGFLCGHGTLILPDGTKVVRSWPNQSRFGGGLSLRGALELVQSEQETARLDRLDEDEQLFGVANFVELQFRVKAIRRDIAERRAEERINAKIDTAAKRKAAKIAMMEAKMRALMDMEKDESDGIDQEFNA